MPDVVNAVLQHGNAFRPQAEGKARILLRIVAHRLQDIGVDHARAQNFDPPAAPADSARVVRPFAGEAINGHIHSRFDKGKVVAPEAHLPPCAEDLTRKLEKGALQVGEGNSLVHRQPLNLVKMPFVGGVRGLVAINLAWHHQSYRRFHALHYPRLHGRGVGPQQHGPLAFFVHIVHPQGVPHVAGRMPLRDVQHFEVVVVPLHFGPFHYAEPHGHKCVGNLPQHLRRGVKPARGNGSARQGYVDPFQVGDLRQSGFTDFLSPTFQPLFQRRFGAVAQGANLAPLLQVQLGQAPQNSGKPAAPSQVVDSPLLQGFGAV